MPAEPQKKRGRLVVYEMPEHIDASPDEIAETVLRAKPKDEWRYEQEARRKRGTIKCQVFER